MPVHTHAWPGTTYEPVVEIGYPYELPCEYRYDSCAVYAGDLPPVPGTAVVAATATEVGPSMGISQVLPSPAGVTPGDLLVAFASLDGAGGGDPGMTPSTGWTALSPTLQHSTVVRLGCWARLADGSATDTLTLTQGTGGTCYCAAVHRITNHGVTNVATDVKRAQSGNTAGNADPPSLDAGSVKEWLWLAAAALDRIGAGYSITAMPAGYTQIVSLNSGSTTVDTNLAVAQRTVSAQVENPGTFTNTSWYWLALTVAVPGGAGSSGGPVPNPGIYGPWWLWDRLECETVNVGIVRGSAQPAQRPSSATATLELRSARDDGSLAPWWRDPDGVRQNRANLPLRVGVDDTTTTWWLFTGWVDTWLDADDVDDPVITITASDGFKHLSRVDLAETAPQGAGEAAGARINRVLDRAGWMAGRELSLGTFELQATTMAKPALEEIYLTADTEAGAVWVDTTGRFRFVDRDWFRTAARTVKWRVGDGADDELAVCATSIVSVADDMNVENVIGISRIGGTASFVEDAASVAKYGRRTWSRFDLPYANDFDTATILAVQLDDRANRDYYVQAIILSPMTEPEAWPVVLGVELFDTVYVTRRRGDDHLAEIAQVIGVEHSLDAAQVSTVLTLGPRIRQANAHYDADVYDVALYSGT